MTGLLDINVILDVLLARQPFEVEATAIWKACDEGRFKGHVSAVSFPIIFYIVRKAAGLDRAKECVRVCLDAFIVAPVTRDIIEAASALPGSDFEDNVQIACAIGAGLDIIVTRDPKGLKNARVPALSPAELLMKL
ncbi:MAG: hypothetical protein JWP03_4949 [Phycisphaerales bacterium]|jgi:predicted nucleic acid-binding protein|nr:hypothetical protein [Phycisphaerales bacterium]